MWSALRHFFAAPRADSANAQPQEAVVLGQVINAWLIGMIALTGSIPFQLLPASDKAVRAGIAFSVVSILLVCRFLLHRGHVKLASCVTLAIVGIGATAVVVSAGSIRAPVTSVYVLLVVMAGLLLGRLATRLVVALCASAIAGLIVAERAQWLVPKDTAVGLPQWATLAVAMSLVAVFIDLSLRARDAALVGIRRELELRRKTEEALCQTEERLRTTLDSISDGVIATDLESRVTGMNPSAEHLTGWALAQALGQRLTDVFRCVDTITREPVANRLHPVLSDGETLDMFDGATLLARNGREHRIADSVAPIRASSGEIIGMVLVFRDATAEYAAREKEARDADLRRQIGDVAKIGAWQLDVPSMDIVWSDELRGLYGLAPEAEVFFGRGLEYVVPEDRALAAAALRAGMEHGTPWDFDVRTIGADGVLRWLRSQGRAQMEDGKVVRLTGVVQDVSERNRAQRELEEQRLRMMAIVESAMDGVIAVDAQEHIVIFNSAAERMFGYSASEVLGRPLDRLISAHHRAAHHGHLREFGRTRKIASSMEARGVGAGRGTNAVRANGEEFPIEASISFSEVMGDAMYTVILRDISDRVAAARTLMDQRIELSELTRRMMDAEEATNRALAQSLHDQLGQTLTALRLSFDAFYGALPREAGGAAERWGGRMSDLIDRSVAQVRHVLVELRPALLEEMGLAAAIENEINNHAFVSGDLAIVFEPDAALLAHRWPDKVEYAAFMIAREAIANAVLHSAASCIRVRLTHGAVDLQLIVHDDGRGLTMDRRSHRVGHLGLVGMRERAIAIGGQLRVESAPGTGTTITLSWNAQ